MSTEIRPELSQDNKYYISKHRYYELLHFCRQYTEYLAEKEQILATCVRPVVANHTITTDVMASHRIDHMERWAIRLADVDDKIKLIEQAAVDTDEQLSGYILMSVTSGLGFDAMKARYDVPCSRNTFYDRYRKFFWLLDQRR
jgi:hypothetical protein